jgi:bifunctional DNA-binding transcriptional regulator/antitoxin component of YhaV-PrlF toxin-antitoxin module
MELISRTTLVINGGSLHLLVPAAVAKTMGWKQKDVIGIYKDGESLVYKKEVKP